MEILKDRYSITELSERLNITDHTLRYYEKEFNICVPKNDRGRRYYTPELANLMFKIKQMRDDGLQIKAIRKILLSDNTIMEPPPVSAGNSDTTSVAISDGLSANTSVKHFFDEFKTEITASVTASVVQEVSCAREQISQDLMKTKLELGACVENSFRKLETKMEKHFMEVDRSIGLWREKNKKGFFKRLIDKKL